MREGCPALREDPERSATRLSDGPADQEARLVAAVHRVRSGTRLVVALVALVVVAALGVSSAGFVRQASDAERAATVREWQGEHRRLFEESVYARTAFRRLTVNAPDADSVSELRDRSAELDRRMSELDRLWRSDSGLRKLIEAEFGSLRDWKEFALATANGPPSADVVRLKVLERSDRLFDSWITAFRNSGDVVADRVSGDSNRSLRNGRDVLIAVFGLSVLMLTLLLVWARYARLRVLAATTMLGEVAQANQRTSDLAALLRTVIDGTSNLIFAKGSDRRYILANEAMNRVLIDSSRESIILLRDDELMSRADRDLVVLHEDEMLEAEVPKTFEETLSLKGEVRHFITTRSPLIGADGRTIGLVGVATDVTEEKVARGVERVASALHGIARAKTTSDVARVFVEAVEDALEVDAIALWTRDDAGTGWRLRAEAPRGTSVDFTRSLPRDAAEAFGDPADGPRIVVKEADRGVLVFLVPGQSGDVDVILTVALSGVGAALEAVTREALSAACVDLQRGLEVVSLAEAERALVRRMQFAMLGNPNLNTKSLATCGRYIAAESDFLVGGDWFDVFEFPDGRIGIGIGDIVGHGVDAAIAAGQCRSALFGSAASGEAPDLVIERLDRFAGVVAEARYATCLYLTLEPVTRTIRWVRAGHPPLLLIHGDGRAEFLERGGGLPLGMPGGAGVREIQEMVLDPDSTVVAFTDGLIEDRSVAIEARMQRLADLVVGVRTCDVETIATQIAEGMLAAGTLTDDIAFVVCGIGERRPNFEWTDAEVSRRSVPEVRERVERWLTESGIDRETTSDIVLALSEIVTNSVEHAWSKGTRGRVRIYGSIDSEHIEIAVEDDGRWQRRREASEGGFGLMIASACMNAVEVLTSEAGTVVKMKRERHSERTVGKC